MGNLISAARKQIKYARNEARSGDAAKADAHLDKAEEFLGRAADAVAVFIAEPEGEDGLFNASANDATAYLTGGSPGNPDGVTFTTGDARRWWEVVFADGLNISRVRPTLLPGSFVLSQEGYAKAVALGVESTVYAPADWNPLGLEVVP